jgi:hypothetical protein
MDRLLTRRPPGSGSIWRAAKISSLSQGEAAKYEGAARAAPDKAAGRQIEEKSYGF